MAAGPQRPGRVTDDPCGLRPSALIAAIVLSERLEPMQLAGGALILVGIAGASGLLSWGRRREAVV